MENTEQPDNDRYVIRFCICAAIFWAGYSLATYHHERADRAPDYTTKGQQ